MSEVVESLMSTISSEISKCDALITLGAPELSLVHLRKANEAITNFLADTANISRYNEEGNLIFGGRLIWSKGMRKYYKSSTLKRLDKINQLTRTTAHLKSEEESSELLSSNRRNRMEIITLIDEIIKHEINTDFKINRLENHIVHNNGQLQGGKLFDKIATLFFKYGESPEYNLAVDELLNTSFSFSKVDDMRHDMIKKAISNIDLSVLIDIENPSDELFFYLINSMDEDAIRTAGRLAKKHTNHRWLCAVNFALGEVLYGNKADDLERIKFMKRSIANYRKLGDSEYAIDLFNEVLVAAHINACNSYQNIDQKKRAEDMIIGLEDDVQRHGTSRVKFAYFHCFSHTKNILNQPSNGQEYAQKALVIADQEQNAEMKCDAISLLALSAQKLGNQTLADNLLGEAKEIAMENNFRDRLKAFGLIEGYEGKLID